MEVAAKIRYNYWPHRSKTQNGHGLAPARDLQNSSTVKDTGGYRDFLQKAERAMEE